METLNAYLDPIEEVPCPDCANLPDDLLCQACEWVQPCDYCGDTITFRDVATGALLCRACTQRAIEEEPLAPEERRREGIALWAHGAVSVTVWVGYLAITWVAFNPSLSDAGLTLHGTMSNLSVGGAVALSLWFFAGHGVVEHFWPERR